MQVYVYYNLHKHAWSIKALAGKSKGLVIGYAKSVYLGNVKPKVSEAGRQRALREQQKNIHAGLVGDLLCVTDDSNLWRDYPYMGSTHVTQDTRRVTYDPYVCGHFVMKDEPTLAFQGAPTVMLLGKGQVFSWGADTMAIGQAKQLQLNIA